MDWVGIITAATATATAIFAGIGVTMIYLDRRSRITAEFSASARYLADADEPWRPAEEKPSVLGVHATVTNNTDRTIRVTRFRVDGVPLSGYGGPFVREPGVSVPIGVRQNVDYLLNVDWPAWEASRSPGKHSPMVRASLIIDRNTRVFRSTSRIANVVIAAETIEKNAAKATQK